MMKKGKILVVDDNQGIRIGLSLSRQIMRAHNGQLDLTRSDEQATEFTLTFR